MEFLSETNRETKTFGLVNNKEKYSLVQFICHKFYDICVMAIWMTKSWTNSYWKINMSMLSAGSQKKDKLSWINMHLNNTQFGGSIPDF